MVEFSDLSKTGRYDIRLVKLPFVDITWSSGVDRVKVLDAITELMAMKEKRPHDFEGDIVISKAPPVLPANFNGAECEEDVADSGSSVVRYLPSSGRDVSGDRIHHECGHGHSLHTIGPKKICVWSVNNPNGMPAHFGDSVCDCEGLEG